MEDELEMGHMVMVWKIATSVVPPYCVHMVPILQEHLVILAEYTSFMLKHELLVHH